MKMSFFSVLLVLALGACQSEDPKPDSYDIWLPAAMKEDCYFLPGSYWVYYEPGTGFFDSIWVVSARLDTLPILHKGSRDTLGYKEQFEVTFQSIFFGSRFKHFSEVENNCIWFGDGTTACHWVNRGNLNGKAEITTKSRIIGYPFVPGQIHPIGEGNAGDNYIRLDSNFLNYTLDSAVFPSVKMTFINIDPTQQNSQAHRYFAKGVGVVRRHLPLGNIDWRLIRFRAVQ